MSAHLPTSAPDARSQPEVWRSVWRATQLTEEGVRKTILREQRTRRWQAIRRSFLQRFGTLRGITTIELGAGTGDISLLLALEGATPTLLALWRWRVGELAPGGRSGAEAPSGGVGG